MADKGSGTGGGGGYNIPVSLSAASSVSTPLNQAAGTVFNFNSPGASGDVYHQEANPVNPATATSSAALGGDSNAETALGNLGQATGIPPKYLLIGGGVVAAVVVIGLFLYLRKG